ncbi:MAG TPA: hypothetical protein VK864_19305, partial [Longimicrobiales bacterium]|nr:hypothetical protein [Longimicrobiales bacterium]
MRIAAGLVPVSASLVAFAAGVAGQGTIADRINRSQGTVRFSYAAKPGVCGDGAATIYVRDGANGRRVTI